MEMQQILTSLYRISQPTKGARSLYALAADPTGHGVLRHRD